MSKGQDRERKRRCQRAAIPIQDDVLRFRVRVRVRVRARVRAKVRVRVRVRVRASCLVVLSCLVLPCLVELCK